MLIPPSPDSQSPEVFLSSNYPDLIQYGSASFSASLILFPIFSFYGSLPFLIELCVDFLRFHFSRGPVKRQKKKKQEQRKLNTNLYLGIQLITEKMKGCFCTLTRSVPAACVQCPSHVLCQ